MEIKDQDSRERADGVEQGIIRGGGTAGYERLVDFIERGVDGGGEPGGESPKPAPTLALAAHSSIQQNTENEILGEVCRLADEAMDGLEPVVGQARNQPVQERREDRGGVLCRKAVGGHQEDHDRPE